jgi:PAS domain S-box-containing protein
MTKAQLIDEIDTLEQRAAATPEGGSELKRREQELAEKEAQLRLVFDNMPGAIVYTNEELNLVFCSDRFADISQAPSELLQPGCPYPNYLRYLAEHGYYGEGDVDAFVAERVESLRNPSDKTFETYTPDGYIHTVRRRRAAAGGTVTVVTDITEQKRAEEELARKEAQLRAALDNMPGGMMLGDRDFNYVLFNSQYSELCEFPDGLLEVGGSIRDELRYQADRGDFGPGDKDELIEEVIANYRQGEAASWERTISGNGRIIEIYVAPTPEGGYVSIITDITERKRAEQELAEKEAQLRVALDNMPGGMALGDRDLNYVLFNSQYSELYEYPDGQLKVGGSLRDELRHQADRGDFGPGDKDELIEQVLAIYQRGEAVSYERAIAGTGRTLEVYLAPTPEGGYVTIATDISARKRAEEELLEAKRRTEEASKLVGEKNRMLESLSNQLSKYLSPQVYASIFSGEQSVEIASKRKKLTVFFSDIADFTETTDSLESEELTNLLNRYLTEMSKIALDHGATIDKYVGDAIIAFFGDPETRGVKEDARTCVNMAIAMQRRMRELHSEWLDMGLERPFELRIGINTGFCTVGNFGSADRMDYTIIGNEVNLAARLESHAEVGGILMAHETHSLVKDTVLAEEGDTLSVKGFAKPVRTYSVTGLYDDLAEQGRIIRKDEDGLTLILDRNKLTKKSKARAIKAVEDVLSQLKG